MKHIFKRKIYDRLKAWKERSAGSTAILIEGARRVGKSTIAKEFARNEYDSYILVDFSDLTPQREAIFENIADRDMFFTQLQLEYGVRLQKRKSVIIFDEIQFAPRVRQAIKHLVADGRFDYIETGSLISIHKNVKDIMIPSERRV